MQNFFTDKLFMPFNVVLRLALLLPKKWLRCQPFFLLLIFSQTSLYADNRTHLSEPYIKAQYIYNFIELTRWPEDAQRHTLTLGFYGSNAALLSEFEKLLQDGDIRGKKIHVSTLKNLSNLKNIDALIISAAKSQRMDVIASKAIKTQTLLISDATTDKKSIMLNFMHNKNKRIAFEINKSNLVYEGFHIAEDILLYGGTEVDVALLYKEMALSLREMKDQLQQQTLAQNKQQQEIKQQGEEITRRNQQMLIANQKIEKSRHSLANASQQLQVFENELDVKKQELTTAKAEVNQVVDQRKADVEHLEQEIQSNKAVLNRQIKEINRHKDQIRDKNIKVEELGATVSHQQTLIISSITLFLVVFLLLASMFISYRRKQEVQHEREVHKATQSHLKLKSDFITAISHELRTPMHGIMGGLQLLQQQKDESLTTPLALVEKSAADMMSLINDILDYTELKEWQVQLNSKPVHLAHRLKESQNRYQGLCHNKGIKLQWQIAADLPESVLIDAEKLITILEKILDNAVKFTDKGQVRFSLTWQTSEKNSHLLFTIEDSGIGIKAEEKQYIYEAFKQNEAGFQRRYGGLGIGLCIAYQLTEFMHGTIEMQSEPGQGSRFNISFPAQENLQPQEPETDTRPKLSAQLPILVVEDNLINQKVLVKMLEKVGYTSVVANNGEEALEILKQKAVSLILMDLQMPVMDGFSCTESIRSNKNFSADLPIIAVTANLMAADKQHCLDVGMNDYLAKPVSLNKLQQSLLNYLELPASIQAPAV
ncbi:MAG: DUF4154 domain-containing protein [Pseudomonadales bacterium]|nr:DUF4154 domain-containing protein [Pseudomonadales bacterium]